MKLFLSLSHPSNQEISIHLKTHKDIHTTEARTFEDLKNLAASYEYDILLVDHPICVHKIQEITIRSAGTQAENLNVFLSGTTNMDDTEVIRCYENGFDVVIYYTISPKVLVAKLHAILRRVKGIESSVVNIGNVTVNLSKHQVLVGKNKVDLTKKEQNLLECLALNKGKVLSKEFLLDYVYGGMDEPEIRIIDAFIWRIRKKLSEAGQERDYMQTVWGRGYCLNDEKI